MLVCRPLVCKYEHQINQVHELSLRSSFLLHYESAESQAYEGQMEPRRTMMVDACMALGAI